MRYKDGTMIPKCAHVNRQSCVQELMEC